MSKEKWYPVWVPNSGRVTDYVIMEGDPVNGTFIGCYGDMSTAHYHARLHNNFVSPIGLLNEIDAMFQSEIDFRITAAWDGGLDWDCGHRVQGNEATIEETLVAIVNAAKILYPDSDFTRSRPYEVPLSEDLYEMEIQEIEE